MSGHLSCSRYLHFGKRSWSLLSLRRYLWYHVVGLINLTLHTHKLLRLLCSQGAIKSNIHLDVPSTLGLTLAIIPMKQVLRLKVVVTSDWCRLFGTYSTEGK